MKETNLEVRGVNLEEGDLIALNPDCSVACESSSLIPFTYSLTKEGDTFMTEMAVSTGDLAEENCVCVSFGADNWMKYTSMVLHVPEEDMVSSVAEKAYMLPVSSLYRRLEENVLTRVDVQLLGHVGLLKESYPYIVRASEACTAETAVEPVFTETRDGQYGSAKVSVQYQVVGMPESSYKLCYKIGNRSVVTVNVEVLYKEISPAELTVLRGSPFTFTVGSDSQGFANGDKAFWSKGTDCSNPVTDVADLEDGVFTWSGVTPYVEEQVHMCLKFVGTADFAPLRSVVMNVVGFDDEELDLVVDSDCSLVTPLRKSGHVVSLHTVDYDGDHETYLDTILATDDGFRFNVVEAYLSGVARLGLVAEFEDLNNSRVFIPHVVITLRRKPQVVTTKMYLGREYIMELMSTVMRPTETVTIVHDGEKVYANLPLEHLYENMARATVTLNAGAGEYSVLYHFANAYCTDLREMRIGTINVIAIESVDSTIVSEYQQTTFRMHTSVAIPSVEADRIQLCDAGCACETVYASGTISSENQIGEVVPRYVTKLQLTTLPIHSKLSMCYKIGSMVPVDTGIVMTVLKITSFELTVVPEGVTIENIPVTGSGVSYGDVLRLVPFGCEGMATAEAMVVYTNRYVARQLTAPMLPEACESATLKVFYVPMNTQEPIDLHQSVSVVRSHMTASVESQYNLFGKVEMTFNVQGTTNLQEMVFFFKYASGSDATAYSAPRVRRRRRALFRSRVRSCRCLRRARCA